MRRTFSSKLLFSLLLMMQFSLPAFSQSTPLLTPDYGAKLALIGNTLGERMQFFNHFETALHQNFPSHQLSVRNLCWPADTPDLRPRSHGRDPGRSLIDEGPNLVFAFFGYNESFAGEAGLAGFETALANFVSDSLINNDKLYLTSSNIVLFSPIAFEDLSDHELLPNGVDENRNIALYTRAMAEVAANLSVHFVDLYTPTRKAYQEHNQPLTINGCHLNDRGYRILAGIIHNAVFGKYNVDEDRYDLLHQMVSEKSFQFFHEFRPVNGVHIYGERKKPYGVVNFPPEFKKLDKMVANRDKRIWEIASRRAHTVEVDDSNTGKLPPVITNYDKPFKYLSAAEALEKFTVADGYKVNLFASEEDFPHLANPVRLSFDDAGRLWVAVMPTYPQYLPGVAPHDKLLILEDTDNDGQADKQITFADNLHLPTGFEFGNGGVFVAQPPNLVFLKDTDGDDKADVRDIVLSGFSSHDSHHCIGAFAADPSGSIYMAEGIFLYSQVETPYGPVRAKDGAIYRFDPKTWHLEPTVRFHFWNPWGIGFDDYGDGFIGDASDGANYKLSSIRTTLPYGKQHGKDLKSFTWNNHARPTAGIEIVSSRHFADEHQGDFLVNNAIGFLGTKQHQLINDGAGYRTELRHDLISSEDPNFRPVALEFAPDGSLYIVDWHNPLVGHMQHSARDPNRDHAHGRVWRITHESRPLVPVKQVVGASTEALLELLKEPEYRTRYRALRVLREKPLDEVQSKLKAWVANLDSEDSEHDRHVLEALNVSWGTRQIDTSLLERCLKAENERVRAAAVRILNFTWQDVPDYLEWFLLGANDSSPIVRIEAMMGASRLPGIEGARVAAAIAENEREFYLNYTLSYGMVALRDATKQALESDEDWVVEKRGVLEFMLGIPDPTKKPPLEAFVPTDVDHKTWNLGAEVYKRDAHCITCHGADGKGIEGIYPPLAHSEWVSGDESRLIKLTLDGMEGDIYVNGKRYAGDKVPPMTAFKDLLTDEELAAVLSYIRNAFGNKGEVVSSNTVADVRAAVADKNKFWTAKELLQQHPWSANYSHLEPMKHAAIDADVAAEPMPSPKYHTNIAGLTDGSRGPLDYNNPNWIGYEGGGATITIELAKQMSIGEVGVDCLADHDAWVFFPTQIEFFSSVDGESFSKIGELNPELEQNNDLLTRELFMIKTEVDAKFLQIRMRTLTPIPDWHKGNDGKGWIFIDEVVVHESK